MDATDDSMTTDNEKIEHVLKLTSDTLNTTETMWRTTKIT